MNNDNCSLVNVNWNSGGLYRSTDCSYFSYDNSSYSLMDLVNISRVDFTVLLNRSDWFNICKYDMKGNYVSNIKMNKLSVGEHSVDLDPNYLYKMSYATDVYTNPKLYKCNTGIGSMSNSLAFGSSSFLDTIGVIIPFIIILIAFALGFKFLKKIVKSTSKGKANV